MNVEVVFHRANPFSSKSVNDQPSLSDLFKLFRYNGVSDADFYFELPTYHTLLLIHQLWRNEIKINENMAYLRNVLHKFRLQNKICYISLNYLRKKVYLTVHAKKYLHHMTHVWCTLFPSQPEVFSPGLTLCHGGTSHWKSKLIINQLSWPI